LRKTALKGDADLPHIHIPKPLHGWRALLGEIGVIMVGVLLALGAEQLIEQVHFRHQRHASIDAMGRELTEDDGFIANGRFEISRCIEDRLAAISDAVARHAPLVEVARLAEAYRVPPATFDDEAWQAANQSGALLHAGKDATLEWADHYNVVAVLDRLIEHERTVVGPLRAIRQDSARLDPVERQAILTAVGALREDNRLITSASATFLQGLMRKGYRTPEAMVLAEQKATHDVYGNCAVPSLTASDLARRPFPDDPFVARMRAIQNATH
jgi:hypothetical protein